MGGLGKTTVAIALLHDPDIAAEFYAERYWIKVGRERTPTSAQADLLHDVTGKYEPIDHVDGGRKRLQEVSPARTA